MVRCSTNYQPPGNARPGTLRAAVRPMWSVGPAVACLFLAVGHAAGQLDGPPAQGKSGRRSTVKPTVPRNPVHSSGCGSKAQSPAQPKRQGRISRVNSTGPQPKWACASEEVTAAKHWVNQQIECAFEITNKGEADLKIRARGG